jgi:hypothetical protein
LFDLQRSIRSVAGWLGMALAGVSIACSSDGDGGQAPANGGGAPGSCTGSALPPVSDYGARGPYDVTVVNDTGPTGLYTMFRPTQLGANGFKHPPATWGNGIGTTPSVYTELLSTVASHGFVVIASNSTTVNAQLMTEGLDWLISQNDLAGEFQGKLAVGCAITIGYSLGGGGAVNAGSHPNVVTTVSFHGLQGAAESLSGPLFLLTSTNDSFVTKAQFVQPCYDRSTTVPTVMATLEVAEEPSFMGHLIPLNDAQGERAPAVAWLRYWVYGDQAARRWFYGSDCTLCSSPWTDIQRKNAEF